MKIAFDTPLKWQRVNEALTDDFGFKPREGTAHLYRGLRHAILEATMGLVRTYPHKTKAYYVRGQTPYFERAMRVLAADGFDVQPIDLSTALNQPEWVDQVPSETGFVLYAWDDPLLGQVYPLEEFQKRLIDKKIFSLEVSHQRHFFQPRPEKIERFQLKLCALEADLAVGLFGARAKISGLSCDSFVWSSSDIERAKASWVSLVEDQAKVSEFESNLPSPAKPLFPKESPRLWDRAAFYFEDIDGFSFVTYLAEALEIDLAEAGADGRLETASLSRWGGVRTMDWLKQQGLSDNQIRGLVLISQDLLDTSILQRIQSVQAEIYRIQNGDK